MPYAEHRLHIEIGSGGDMSLDAPRSGAGIDIDIDIDLGHSVVEVNGTPMRVAEAGTGPLVVLLHGFPESWYSWRHQLRALAEAGFHAVAPNQRGYPGTHTPAARSCPVGRAAKELTPWRV
jgi:dipeptidyl aminopeptidase/acylaminoacyl peptidase